MTQQPDRPALTAATQAARTALQACGAANATQVSSHPVTGRGYPDGTILTQIRLQPHGGTEEIIAALRGLPCLVDLWSADDSVVVLRSPTPTIFGPGGRDGLTMREAVRQSRLIHPDWSPDEHVDWLIEDGYRFHRSDRGTVQAMVTSMVGSTRPGDERLEASPLPALPPGGRLLSADEAVDLLVTGDHPDSRRGSLILDAAMIEALRAGQIVACLLADGQIAFTRVTQATTDPAHPATRSDLPGAPQA
jgi:hypothetical protein